MNQWTKAGIAILVVSSEMPELLAMSDRVVVMHRGRRTAEFNRDQVTPDWFWKLPWECVRKWYEYGRRLSRRDRIKRIAKRVG